MGCGYGPVPIIPDIDRKIGSSIFIRADAQWVLNLVRERCYGRV